MVIIAKDKKLMELDYIQHCTWVIIYFMIMREEEKKKNVSA